MAKRYDPNAGRMVDDERKAGEESAQRTIRRKNRGGVDAADWSSVDSARVVAAISAITRHGFAVRFGYTRDKGAYAIGIIGDGEPFTEFVRPTESIELYLDGLISDYGK